MFGPALIFPESILAYGSYSHELLSKIDFGLESIIAGFPNMPLVSVPDFLMG